MCCFWGCDQTSDCCVCCKVCIKGSLLFTFIGAVRAGREGMSVHLSLASTHPCGFPNCAGAALALTLTHTPSYHPLVLRAARPSSLQVVGFALGAFVTIPVLGCPGMTDPDNEVG